MKLQLTSAWFALSAFAVISCTSSDHAEKPERTLPAQSVAKSDIVKYDNDADSSQFPHRKDVYYDLTTRSHYLAAEVFFPLDSEGGLIIPGKYTGSTPIYTDDIKITIE